METAVESSAPVAAEEMCSGDDGQIVVVRPRVVDTVGHVLGNMFQRIYHLVDRTREGDVAVGADLDGSIRRLESFLQLLMDYVSPLTLSVQEVTLADVAESLAQQLGAAAGHAVRVGSAGLAQGRLLADAGRVTRAFSLLCSQVRPAPAPAAIHLTATAASATRSFTLVVSIPRGCLFERSSESEIRWAVAEKLLEMHGGMLQQSSTVSGETLWEIMLPLQS